MYSPLLGLDELFQNWGLITAGDGAGVDAVGAAPLVAFLVFGSAAGVFGMLRCVGASGVLDAGSEPL